MDGSNFDGFTKKLSATRTRREAVRLFGGMLAAAALGALRPGWAESAGNSTCAKFCASVFGADTPAASQCTSDAAHGAGLCYSCGPTSAGGTQPICCATNSSGACSSYNSATCCLSGQTCQNGQCVTPTTTTTTTTTTPAPCGYDFCYSNSDCCSGLCCNHQCCSSSSTHCASTSGNCCLPSGYGSCYYDADCCSGTCNTSTNRCN